MDGIKTEILKINSTKPEIKKVKEAAEFIKSGDVVVFPTETVYGIGADAFNEEACKRIFEIKGRPGDNPLIVHVSSIEMAEKICEVPTKYKESIKRIWPSPITFIMKARNLPKVVTAGLDTVAVRMPAHPVALALVNATGPIAAPSANPAKRPTATNAGQAAKYFDGKVSCIIDSGRAFFGIESTIIDLRDFKILRPGPFTPDEIEKAFGMKPKIDKVTEGRESAPEAISPGTKYAHYAPDTPLVLFEGTSAELVDYVDHNPDLPSFAFIGSKESCSKLEKELSCSTIGLGSKKNMYEIAKNLYDGLSALDSLKVKLGIIESFEEKGIGLAIMNRIRKATGNKMLGGD